MSREILYLCIGLDVGTSTTKVVIHPLYGYDSFFVVDFGKDKTEDATYLLPTNVALNEETGQFELPIYNSGEKYAHSDTILRGFFGMFSKNKPHKQKILKNLKLNFMNQSINSTEYLRVFIALVIQYSKNWFVKTYGDADFVRNKDIVWAINMGIPSAKFSAEGENKKYLDLLKTAYNLSMQNVISENNYRNIYNQELDIEYSIIPEIVATISSFVKLEGVAARALYCAVDIGAGTTDVCTFRINNQDTYSFFRSSVLELGADRYNEAQYKHSFLTQFFEQLGSVIWRTKCKRDPNAQEWSSSLPLVICGGGSYIEAYKNVINQYEHDILIAQLGHRGFRGYNNIILPKTQYIYVSDRIDPKRLLVARGLCLLFEDFYDDIKERYTTETEIEDIHPSQQKEYEDPYQK